jgi:(p)ppGpp synthase/HD superfamily hydrolase
LNHYAQTILQLYAQLRELGCSKSQLLLMRGTYELAVSLFTSQFRANGKPFLAHLVGTASILATHGASISVVAAGLLHAAYLQGEFGDGRAGITNARRRKVRQTVGDEVEKLIFEYTRFAWNRQTIIAMQDHINAPSPEQRHLVLIRLANDLEEHLDLGMLYSNRRDRSDRARPLVAVADRLGYCELAQDLASVYADHNTTSVPDVLRTDQTNSYTVVPASHRRRLLLVMAGWLNKVHRLLKASGVVRQPLFQSSVADRENKEG